VYEAEGAAATMAGSGNVLPIKFQEITNVSLALCLLCFLANILF